MPVENERKFVLKMVSGLENEMRRAAHKVYLIEQGYLVNNKGLTVRIRRQQSRKKAWHVMTVKTRVSDERIIEIEKKISEMDYREMVPHAGGWVHKIRYVIGDWEVDFFKNVRETYFVMAEIEMPDGVDSPESIPDFVADHLLFTVPRDDCRFSSKKISDVDYAQKLLEEVKGKAASIPDAVG